MFEVGDIIAWSDRIEGEQYEYIGLILRDCNRGIFEVSPLSPQFIEEVRRIGDGTTIKLRLNGFDQEEWRIIC
jgi:hypothetical protein